MYDRKVVAYQISKFNDINIVIKTLNEAIAKRKSTRSYKSVQIPEEALEKIIKAGCAAPVARAQYDSLNITVIQNEHGIDTENRIDKMLQKYPNI